MKVNGFLKAKTNLSLIAFSTMGAMKRILTPLPTPLPSPLK